MEPGRENGARWGLWRFLGFFLTPPPSTFLNKFTVTLCGHPDWCACKEARTEFFIIGLWDLRSLLSNQVHMPIVMDSAPWLLWPRQRVHTNQNLHAWLFFLINKHLLLRRDCVWKPAFVIRAEVSADIWGGHLSGNASCRHTLAASVVLHFSSEKLSS